MQMIKRILRPVVSIGLCVGGLYACACAIATLVCALNQPYLLSAVERFDYMGYYIMAGAHWIIFLLCAGALIWWLIATRKWEK